MPTIHINLRERSLLERILYGLLLLTVVVLGFFFIAAALVVGAALAGVMLLRYWWLRRKLQREADSEFITTDYTVVEREKPELPPPGVDERR